jgi:hypothetical protein
MNEDDRIDEIIRSAASDYNLPPATPRDEMWAAIQAARTTPGPRLHVAAGGSAAASYTSRSHNRFAPRVWWGAAAAAVLLVAAGVGIGRWTSAPTASTQSASATRPVAVATTPEAAPAVTEQTPESAILNSPEAETANASGTKSRARTPEEIRRSPRIIGSGTVHLASGQASSPNHGGLLNANATAVSYQVATQKHLADAEALLTSFSLEGRDARMDSQFAGWAKGLLSNTRLLLDSPAGDDPRRAKLLQDLELVLAQIVQLSPNAPVQERELIQGSIQDGHVMTRLRSAIPAGQPRGIQEK